MTAVDIENVIKNRLKQQADENANLSFIFGEFIDSPNNKGVFQLRNQWFIYENDERNIKSITGPFRDDDIIYACTKLLHISKHFEEYRFSKDAKNTYIHVHFRSIKEAEESL